MNITITTIPHESQRYDTVGDWQFDANGNLLISVSDVHHWTYHALVGLHEFVEALLCRQAGITTEQVDKFDMTWEPPEDGSNEEPGMDPKAPYHVQHMIAQAVEYAVAVSMGVGIAAYEKALDDCGQNRPHR